jgi:hypothetical protein
MFNRKYFQSIEGKLDLILATLKLNSGEIKNMDADIQALVDQAKKNTDAEASAVGAINALAVKLAAAIQGAASLSPADRATLQQEVTDMQTSAAAIGAAVVANTPAA